MCKIVHIKKIKLCANVRLTHVLLLPKADNKLIKLCTWNTFYHIANQTCCRTNQTLKTRLSKLTAEHQTDWDEYLEEVAFSLRTQRQGSIKFTPCFLMFNHHTRLAMEVIITLLSFSCSKYDSAGICEGMYVKLFSF